MYKGVCTKVQPCTKVQGMFVQYILLILKDLEVTVQVYKDFHSREKNSLSLSSRAFETAFISGRVQTTLPAIR